MKTPEEIAVECVGEWRAQHPDVFGGLTRKIAAALAAEREQTTIARTGLGAAVDELVRLRADLTAVCETLDMVLAASPTPPVGPVLDRITKYRAWRDGALMTDERDRLRADLAEAREVVKDLLEWFDDYTPAEFVDRARALLDRLKGEQK